jgi:hypothetical protein
MGANTLDEKFGTQNLFSRSDQLAQKFGILLKKGFIGRQQSASKDYHRRRSAPVQWPLSKVVCMYVFFDVRVPGHEASL